MAGTPRTPEAFSRVVIGALLKDVGWNLSDGRSVRYEYQLAAMRIKGEKAAMHPLSEPEVLRLFLGPWAPIIFCASSP